MSARSKAVIFLLLAACNYAGANISGKLGAQSTSVWQLGFGRFAMGALATLALARVMHLDLRGQSRGWLFWRGLSGTLTFLGMMASFQLIPLSQAMVLFYLYPALSGVFSPWLTGERTGLMDWMFISGALLGSAMILWPGQGQAVELGWGHLLALGSAVTCGFQLAVVRKLARNNNSFAIYFHFCVVGLVISSLPIAWSGEWFWPEPGWGLFWVVMVGLLATVAQIAMNRGLQNVNAAQAGPLLMLELPATAGYGIARLGEPLTASLVVGGLLILVCGLLLNLAPGWRRKKDGAPSPAA